LIDGTGAPPLLDAAIRIEHGAITAVGTRAEFGSRIDEGPVDLSGKFVLPGLINMHAHLAFAYRLGPPMELIGDGGPNAAFHAGRLAVVMLAQGITTARDMGGRDVPIQLRDAIRRGTMLGPDLMCCGQPLSITGGHAWQVCAEADGADGFRHAARQQLKSGADFIKVMASHDPWPMPRAERTRAEVTGDEMAAAFDVAHEWGLLAGCHVMGSRAIERALDAGADILDHGHYLTDALAERMAASGVYLVPTLSSYDVQTLHPRFVRGPAWCRAHEPLLDGHRGSVAAAIRAGVAIVVGTDTVGCVAEEVALLREAGLSPMESLQACTSGPAAALRRPDIGTVAAGRNADLAVLAEDPLADPAALESVTLVVQAGVIRRTADLLTLELALGGDLWDLVRRPTTSTAPDDRATVGFAAWQA
jgi:imidazolonepropionase-like amidohydrolase